MRAPAGQQSVEEPLSKTKSKHIKIKINGSDFESFPLHLAILAVIAAIPLLINVMLGPSIIAFWCKKVSPACLVTWA
jgi:hypothetical protein